MAIQLFPPRSVVAFVAFLPQAKIWTKVLFGEDFGLQISCTFVDLRESSFERMMHEAGAVFFHSHDKDNHKICEFPCFDVSWKQA